MARPRKQTTSASRRNPETTPTITPEQLEAIVNERIAAAMAQYELQRNSGGDAGGSQVNETTDTTQRGCSYKSFMGCKPPTYSGREGAVGLLQWFEKMESVLSRSNTTDDSKVKYAVGTLSQDALSWWNGKVKEVTLDVAHQFSWDELKEFMIKEFCPRNELQKLESEFWNLRMDGANVTAYTQRFRDLARLVPKMVTPEADGIDRYIWGLSPEIQGNVMSAKPTSI